MLSPLHALTSLVDLNLASNKLDTANTSLAVFTKAGFPRLVTLDVRGNGLSAEEEPGELVRIASVSRRELLYKKQNLQCKTPCFIV